MLWSISGGAGFLGLHLARRFLADGHEVRTLDLAPLDDAELERSVEDRPPVRLAALPQRSNAATGLAIAVSRRHCGLV